MDFAWDLPANKEIPLIQYHIRINYWYSISRIKNIDKTYNSYHSDISPNMIFQSKIFPLLTTTMYSHNLNTTYVGTQQVIPSYSSSLLPFTMPHKVIFSRRDVEEHWIQNLCRNKYNRHWLANCEKRATKPREYWVETGLGTNDRPTERVLYL